MLFAQTLDIAYTWVAGNLPVVVGGGIAIVVLIILLLINLKHRGADVEKHAMERTILSALQEEKALNWDPYEQSYADRRKTVRRKGVPVRVIVSAPTNYKDMIDGYVLDRSTRGLRVTMSFAMPLGCTLQLRAVDAPDTIDFVTVIVRYCCKIDDYYEVGCKFEKTPPWNVLLLFG